MITLGSHSVSHANLNRVDRPPAEREIVESKQALERIVGRHVGLFAAPFATVGNDLIQAFKDAGYDRVFLNIPSLSATDTGSFMIGRMSV
jgi:peptidoglycan/xylan/chitin deacetylase (PgdA/CDA1 family)